MKTLKTLIIAAAALLLASCASHAGLTHNENSNTTRVVLQNNNYTIVQRVQGSANGVSVLGFGGSFKPLVAQARSEMLASADLVGKPRAIINEIVEENYKIYAIVAVKTVTVSAYVVEFAGTANGGGSVNELIEKKKSIIKMGETTATHPTETATTTPAPAQTNQAQATPAPTPVTNNTEIAQRPADTEEIAGQWTRDNDGLILTISGNVGTLTTVTAGFWQRLINEGRISTGTHILRNFTRVNSHTWRAQELVVGPSASNWRNTTISLSADGNTITIGNPQSGFILHR
ncbi:MAG: hypothetical protein LBU90_00465 [Bacteroidales bacterium]|jgi:hypothetical protein|nr:hypothetical protein [Bacteroidales bacterium]